MDCDVVVVGAGNAAFCAALGRRGAGCSGHRAGAGAGGRERRQQPLHGRRHPLRLSRRRRSQGAHARPDRGGDRTGPISAPTPRTSSSTTCSASREYRTDPGAVRAPGAPQLRDDEVAARQGRALPADLWPPGLQGRRQVQVLGRPDRRGLGRRPGLVDSETATARSDGIEIRYGARATGLLYDGDARLRREGQAGRQAHRDRAQGSVVLACRRLPGESGDAHALSRAGLGTGARCAARASTPATASRWRWRSAPRPSATGPAATPSAGTSTRRNSATSRSATASRSTPIRSASWSMPTGERFVDEGADFRNYTYAKYGRVILEQPGNFAWQIFDQKVAPPAARRIPHQAGHQGHAPTPWKSWRRSSRASTPARSSRRSPPTTRPSGTTSPFNPNVKDGRGTQGPADPTRATGPTRSTSRPSRPIRSAAASPSPSAACASPETARSSTRISRRSAASMRPARWSAASSTSTIPGGTGLMSGAVFGRIAGTSAGRAVQSDH